MENKLFSSSSRLIITDDGSHSVELPDLQTTYHSRHGAIQEFVHVFIEAGLNNVSDTCKKSNMSSDLSKVSDKWKIFEMGFGTGLNALLTLIEAGKKQQAIYYETIEAYPLDEELLDELNYCEQLSDDLLQEDFEKLHQCEWEKEIGINAYFTFCKRQVSLLHFSTDQTFHLIYFDAFAPNAQPELWTQEIFEKLYSILEQGGILVTYCSKGDVRRAMLAAGFSVEKLPGAKGKREMLRGKRV